MTKVILASLLLATAVPALGQQSTTSLPPPVLTDLKVAVLRDNALENDHYAWGITEGLTTEVGQRLAATQAEARAQDGSGYGQFGAPRRQGPTIASKKGALAIVIRSIGTDHHRNPHTGVQYFTDGATPIPAGALSVPDSEQLVRILKRGLPVQMHLTLVSEKHEGGHSGNVIAEVPGRDPKAPILLVGGHLDSWDLGTGAIDDGTGIAITAAAAKHIMDAGRPLRTIRVVWFGAEEPGG